MVLHSRLRADGRAAPHCRAVDPQGEGWPGLRPRVRCASSQTLHGARRREDRRRCAWSTASVTRAAVGDSGWRGGAWLVPRPAGTRARSERERDTARPAIQTLRTAGFVELGGTRRHVRRGHLREDVVETLDVRRALECLVAETGVQHVTNEAFVDLRRLIDRTPINVAHRESARGGR